MITKINKFFENIAGAIPFINQFDYGVLTNDKNIFDAYQYPLLWVNEEFQTEYDLKSIQNKVIGATYLFNVWIFDRWGENVQDPLKARYVQLSNVEQIAQMVAILACSRPTGISPFIKVELNEAVTYVDLYADRLVATSLSFSITMKGQNECEFTQTDINNIFILDC